MRHEPPWGRTERQAAAGGVTVPGLPQRLPAVRAGHDPAGAGATVRRARRGHRFPKVCKACRLESFDATNDPNQPQVSRTSAGKCTDKTCLMSHDNNDNNLQARQTVGKLVVVAYQTFCNPEVCKSCRRESFDGERAWLWLSWLLWLLRLMGFLACQHGKKDERGRRGDAGGAGAGAGAQGAAGGNLGNLAGGRVILRPCAHRRRAVAGS